MVRAGPAETPIRRIVETGNGCQRELARRQMIWTTYEDRALYPASNRRSMNQALLSRSCPHQSQLRDNTYKIQRGRLAKAHTLDTASQRFNFPTNP